MRKLSLAMAVAAAVGAGPALAYDDIGEFEEGVLVAPVYHNGPGDTTVIGFVSNAQDDDDLDRGTSCDYASSSYKLGGTPALWVYWTWFDPYSIHRKDRSFLMTPEDFHGFVWALESGQGFEGEMGYLYAGMDSNGDGKMDSSDDECLTASAFHVNIEKRDVIHVPVFPVEENDIDQSDTCGNKNGAIGSNDLNNLDSRSICDLNEGIETENDNLVYARYAINLDYEEIGTEIIVWTAGDLTLTNPDGITVYQFDTDEHSTSLTWNPKYPELNIIDVETLPGLETMYTDGFIRMSLPDLRDLTDPDKGERSTTKDNDEGAAVWSKIWEYLHFGAVQSIYAAVWED